MKKTLAITLLAGLLGASVAQATEYEIYITGSSAFQKTAYNAITNLFGSSYSSANEVNSGGAGAAGGAMWAIKGQMAGVFGGSQDVQVHATWTGSVQGIYGLQGNLNSTFTNIDHSTVNRQPTVCFSDVDSIATPFPLDGSSYAEYHVAVQPFVWARSVGTPTTVTNVTMQMLSSIAQNSKVALSIFTGNTNDAGNIYLANRNTDSGTRVTAFADLVNAGPSTIYYYSNGLTGPATPGWYASTFNQSSAIFGPGYSGGGGVTGALNDGHANNVAIGYIGVGNANAVNSGKNALFYNGVPVSSEYDPSAGIPAAPTYSYDNVISGKYTFWAYECLDCPIATAPADNTSVGIPQIQAFTRALAGYDNTDTFIGGLGSVDSDVTNNVSKLNVSLNAMHVKRTSVGGPLSKASFPIILGQ